VNILLNVVWLLFGGFWMTIGWLIFGLICCILIITIPFGLAAFRIAGYTFWPFGRTIVQRETAGVPSLIGNIIWVLFAGLWLALGHAITGALLCVTIVGIPLGLAHFKLIPVSLFPLGTKIVSTS
jgi:uncharacterized membrane protein YccF (DUF307 family)